MKSLFLSINTEVKKSSLLASAEKDGGISGSSLKYNSTGMLAKVQHIAEKYIRFFKFTVTVNSSF